VSEIERIPSMRKVAKQGVPKKPGRNMARPAAEPQPKKAAEPQPKKAAEPQPKAAPIESVPAMLEPEPVAAEPAPEPEVEIEPVAQVTEPVVRATAPSAIKTIRETIRRVEESWASFRAAAGRFPLERMDEHISEDGWTRKQMLAHIAAWHDLTADRLVKFMLGGQPVLLDRDEDSFNASVARQAVGKTAGEVLKDTEMTYNRLHRQMSRLTDVQLNTADAWAAHVIAGNTFDHYAEHMADLYVPEPEPAAGRR
jgi:hypothetical protein